MSREEVARTPKARAALDAEWERFRTKGAWDESRVKECWRVVNEANDKDEIVHLGRIFEACYEKGTELEESNPLRKFKGRTVFEGNNVCDHGTCACVATIHTRGCAAHCAGASLVVIFSTHFSFARIMLYVSHPAPSQDEKTLFHPISNHLHFGISCGNFSKPFLDP